MALEDHIPDRLREVYSIKIGLIFLLVVVVTLGVSAVFFAHVAGALGPAAEDGFDDRIDDRSAVAAAWLETSDETASGLATDATIRDGDREAIDAHLADAQADRADRVDEIHYLDGDGVVLESSTEDAVGEAFFDETEVAGETDTASAPHEALGSGDDVLSFVREADHNEGADRYVVVSVPVSAFATLLETDDEYRTLVTDGDETVAAVGDEAVVGDDAVLAALSTDDSGVVTGVPEGTDREYAATTATIGGGLEVTTYGESSSVYGTQETAIAGMTALLFVFVIHLGFVGIVLGGNISLKLRRLASKAEQMGRGDLDVDLETDRKDEVGTLYDSFAAMGDDLDETVTDLESERERARRARAETERRNRELEAEAERFRTVMAACADGNLDRRLEPESDHEAMVEIADAFNAMVADLETTVAQVKRVSSEVAEASAEMQTSSNEIRQASAEVSSSIQEISDGSASQTADMETATTEVKELSATVEEVAATTSTIADQTERVDELVTTGQRVATETTDEMHEASDRTEAVVETIRELEQEARQIQQIVELIDDIASQTNMLALNAAIESSRSASSAGDGGGFQAVADEVKELAVQTQTAVEDIEAMIESIQRRATESATEIEETDGTIAAATDRVDSLSTKLDRIATGIDRVTVGVQEINRATNEQATSAGELATIVQDVASVSTETTAQAERVAAAAEETTATVADVSEEATRLDRRADTLADAVDEFTVSEEIGVGRSIAEVGGDRR